LGDDKAGTDRAPNWRRAHKRTNAVRLLDRHSTEF
jgi:hypothetical protein